MTMQWESSVQTSHASNHAHKFWRIVCKWSELEAEPPQELVWLGCIVRQTTYRSRAGRFVASALSVRPSAGGASVRWAPVEWALWVDTAPGRGCGQSREGFKCARKRAPDYEPAQVRRAISRDDSP